LQPPARHRKRIRPNRRRLQVSQRLVQPWAHSKLRSDAPFIVGLLFSDSVPRSPDEEDHAGIKQCIGSKPGEEREKGYPTCLVGVHPLRKPPRLHTAIQDLLERQLPFSQEAIIVMWISALWWYSRDNRLQRKQRETCAVKGRRILVIRPKHSTIHGPHRNCFPHTATVSNFPPI